MEYLDILEAINERIAAHANSKNWKKELQEVLSLSQNATYKRINGTTPFSVEELTLIASHYQFSLAEVLEPDRDTSGIIRFQVSHPNGIRNFEDYIRPIYRDIARLSSIPNLQLWYAANEIPIFWYFHFPKLILFKYMMWGRITWQLPSLQGRKLKLDAFQFSEVAEEAFQGVLLHYQETDSAEFWDSYILDTTLQQIKFSSKTRLFDDDELVELLECLEQLIHIMYGSLSSGKKNGLGRIKVYQNEIAQTNTCVLVESPSFKAVYSVFKNPNLMYSTSPRLIKETEDWFKNIINHAIDLSHNAEENRLAFISGLERRVALVREEIQENQILGI